MQRPVHSKEVGRSHNMRFTSVSMTALMLVACRQEGHPAGKSTVPTIP